MVWGRIEAGAAANAIPRTGEVHGTIRCLDSTVWAEAGAIITDVVQDVVRPYGVHAEVEHTRGVPPTVNDPDVVALADAVLRAELGDAGVQPAEQSLGGEDFAWILEKVPGAMVRLGTRGPGVRSFELHQPDFTVDEDAIAVGARALAAMALGEPSDRRR
jgi:amidohydrolase